MKQWFVDDGIHCESFGDNLNCLFTSMLRDQCRPSKSALELDL